ncbi:sensor histidine kinase [Hyphomonas sp. NPDC076900]|uniref:sensor histidine kinase n=1 Tax=unclassified Hyphomonas TaxID=2630699 RepID=UPI003D01A67A
MLLKGIGWFLFAWFASVLAHFPSHSQSLERTLRQYHHTAWTEADGAPAEIWALDQGPDGFLWLGTGVGLFRFDGLTFERFKPAPGQQLASIDITSVRVVSANEIWIGYSDGGISQLLDGNVTTYTEQDGLWPGMVVRLLKDANGVIWAGMRGLARFENGQWKKLGPEWGLGDLFTVDLFQARDGTIWLSTADSIFFLRPGATKFEATGAKTSHANFTQTPDGRLWMTDGLHGLRPMPDYPAGQEASPWSLKGATPGDMLAVGGYAIDGQGTIWGTDRLNGGVFRFDPRTSEGARHSILPSDITDVFRRANGLTSDRSLPMLRDREGNIWVGTNAGLDRFRDAALVPVAAVPSATAFGYSVTAADEATFISDGTWLYRALPGEAVRRHVPVPSPGRMIPFRAGDGTLWYGSLQGLYRFEDSHFELVSSPPGVSDAGIRALAEDGDGTLWVAFEQGGVYCLNDGIWTERADLGGTPVPLAAHSDPSGPVWFAYPEGRVARVDETGIRVFSGRDGLAVGNVEAFHISEAGMWVGGEFGIALLRDDHFVSVSEDRVAPLAGVSGIGRAKNGDMLFNGLMGVVRMKASEARKAVEDPSYSPAFTLYDRANGLPGVAQQGWHTPSIVSAADGQTWFIANTGVATFNPAGEVRNSLPPPVTILSVIADGTTYSARGRLTLPKGASTLSIAYTAASLTMPERLQFRYRLKGLDTGWIDAGSGRQAAYSNLAPGRYRFEVMAANEDGVWSTEGAAIEVDIPPTFVQSWIFRLLCGVAFVALLWLLYSIRVRAVANGVSMRMAERLQERERIAREIHDTLLQSVQTLTLRFQYAVDELPQLAGARPALEEALDRADEVIAEGRDRVLDLRSAQSSNLEQVISGIVKRQSFAPSVKISISTSGILRGVDPHILDEVTRIASEAICNIWKHAQARRVKIEICHGANLSLRIADDGIGIDASVAKNGEKIGHFGLKGMGERAKRLGGDLIVRGLPERGTEVFLTVPGRAAYRTAKRGIFPRIGSLN